MTSLFHLAPRTGGALLLAMVASAGTARAQSFIDCGTVSDCVPGTNYCTPALPNSTGKSGAITASGSPLVALNDVTLTASYLPNDFGYFLNSMTRAPVNPHASNGFLCLGGAIGRHNQPGLVQPGPTFSITLDLTSVPTPSAFVAVQPGETWNFQAWYRDVGGTNFTDGLSITFL